MKRISKVRPARIKRISMVLVTVLLVCCFSQAAWAQPAIDISQKGSLTVTESVTIDNTVQPLADLELDLWKVATVTAGVRFQFTADFAPSNVTVQNITASQWGDAADSLLSYAKNQKLTPLATAKTDQTGQAQFGNLDTGLYLAAPKVTSRRVGNHVVTLEPAMLIAIPYQVQAGDAWIYDVPVTAKNTAAPYVPHSATTTYTVTKVWEDENNKAGARPEQVYVRLLSDGSPYTGTNGVVCLTGGNWSHTWWSLPLGPVYTVEELQVPAGYKAGVSGSVITNTYVPEEDVPDPPDDPDDPDDPKGNLPPSGGRPPKTGDESHLLLYLAAACLSGVAVMILLRKEKKKE